MKFHKLVEQFLSDSSIDEFLSYMSFPEDIEKRIRNFWERNLSGVEIVIKNPNTNFLGCVIGNKKVFIKKSMLQRGDDYFSLFLLLHEARHSIVWDKGMEYFESAKNKDKKKFMKDYVSVEKDANDFAFFALNEMGLPTNESFRNNEHMGDMVYDMMTRDIERTGANDFYSMVAKLIDV